MAEAILRAKHGDMYDVYSAGIEATEVNPLVLPALEEIGVDASGLWSKVLDTYSGVDFDRVITVCDAAHRACPFFAGARELIHRGFRDPSEVEGSDEDKMRAFRRARDEIAKWIDDNF